MLTRIAELSEMLQVLRNSVALRDKTVDTITSLELIISIFRILSNNLMEFQKVSQGIIATIYHIDTYSCNK